MAEVYRTVAAVLIAASVIAAGSACRSGSPNRHPSAAAPADAGSSREVTASPSVDPRAQATAAIASFTDEDLVGQVLMPYVYGSDARNVPPAAAAENRQYSGVSTPAEIVSKYRLGGIILMGWAVNDPTAATNKSSNVDSPQQIFTLTGGLNDAARANAGGLPLLIGTDQEYGAVNRIRNGIVQLPAAMTFGAAGDPAKTEAAWRAAGGNLAALGINVDFAPDADVLGSQGSSVIGSRSYGSDPKLVADQVAAATRGLQSAGVAATLKHFPGHGHTTGDSHDTLPVLGQSRADLDSGDLPPFTAGIGAGASLVMTGHLDVKSVDPGTAATFSNKVLGGLLRDRLGFTGVAVTDAMNMAPAMRWPAGEAAVRALMAGNDLLLMPPNLAAVQQGLLNGLKSGALARPRLVEAATRVLALRFKLAAAHPPDLNTLDSESDRTAALAVAQAGVTVLRGPCSGALVSGAVTIAADDRWSQQKQWLTEALAGQGIRTGSGGSTVRLIGYGQGSAALGTANVTVAMDTPYLLRNARGTLIATYSASQASMQALAAVLAGKAAARGRSPVPVSGLPATACTG